MDELTGVSILIAILVVVSASIVAYRSLGGSHIAHPTDSRHQQTGVDSPDLRGGWGTPQSRFWLLIKRIGWLVIMVIVIIGTSFVALSGATDGINWITSFIDDDAQSAELVLTEKVEGSTDKFLIRTEHSELFSDGQDLVVYGVSRTQIEVVIAVVKVIKVQTDSIVVQIVHTHESEEVIANLRVDDQINNAWENNLVPMSESMIGIIIDSHNGLVRHRSNIELAENQLLEIYKAVEKEEQTLAYELVGVVRVTEILTDGPLVQFGPLSNSEIPQLEDGFLVGLSVDEETSESLTFCNGTPVAFLNPPLISEFGYTQYLSDARTGDNPNSAISGILSNKVRSILPFADGSILIGYGDAENAGVTHMGVTDTTTGVSLRLFEQCISQLNQPLGRTVNDIVFDQNDNVWVMTDGDGVWKIVKHTTPVQYIRNSEDPLAKNFPVPNTYSALSTNSNVLFGTLEGLVSTSGESWGRNTFGIDMGLAHTIEMAPNGDIWVGFVDRGIDDPQKGLIQLKPDGSQIAHLSGNGGLNSNNIRSIAIDRFGTVWVGSSEGLNQFKDGFWLPALTTKNSELPSNDISSLEIDLHNRLWVGTSEGVAYFDSISNKWTSYSIEATLAIEIGGGESEVCKNENSHIWIGTDGGGLLHGRLPANEQVVVNHQIDQIPDEVEPGSVLRPIVTVKMDSKYGLSAITGDMLKIIEKSHPDIQVHPHVTPAFDFVPAGGEAEFDFAKFPIVAPHEPGRYKLTAKIWQCGRYVSDEIVIEFVVS